MSPKGVFVVNGQGCKVINIWGGGGLIIKLITTRTSYTIKYCDVLKFEALFSSAYNSQN